MAGVLEGVTLAVLRMAVFLPWANLLFTASMLVFFPHCLTT
ncbi:hypothetical protein PDO_2515 [Rhizobium sp. PDO1-076]|nr:hypothetical protein PDO_2515 [Rhizobium sp. PDO1-076]